MAYQMAPTTVTLNDLVGHSSLAGLFSCNSSTICAAFYKITNDAVGHMVSLRQLGFLLCLAFRFLAASYTYDADNITPRPAGRPVAAAAGRPSGRSSPK